MGRRVVSPNPKNPEAQQSPKASTPQMNTFKRKNGGGRGRGGGAEVLGSGARRPDWRSVPQLGALGFEFRVECLGLQGFRV